MSTLLLDKLSFVMPPLTIRVVFPMLAFKPLFSKASFHFKNLFMCHLIVSLVWTKSSAYSNSFSAPSMADSVTTPTSTAKRKCNSTDPWYIQGGVVCCSYFFSVIYCQCEYLKVSFLRKVCFAFYYYHYKSHNMCICMNTDVIYMFVWERELQMGFRDVALCVLLYLCC